MGQGAGRPFPDDLRAILADALGLLLDATRWFGVPGFKLKLNCAVATCSFWGQMPR